jgi:hypothetical protein
MMEEAEANILSLAVTEEKLTLPFVFEAKFSNSAGYSFMVFDDEAGMNYALIECVAVNQSNYNREQKPRALDLQMCLDLHLVEEGVLAAEVVDTLAEEEAQNFPVNPHHGLVRNALCLIICNEHDRNYTINQNMTPTVQQQECRSSKRSRSSRGMITKWTETMEIGPMFRRLLIHRASLMPFRIIRHLFRAVTIESRLLAGKQGNHIDYTVWIDDFEVIFHICVMHATA